MEFDLSQDQHLLQESLARFLGQEADEEKLRAMIEGKADTSALEAGIADLGLNAMLVPQDLGGLGLGLLDAAAAQEVLGRYAAPVSFMASPVLAVLAILRAATPEQARSWLPKIADGTMRCTLALPEEKSALRLEDGALTGRSAFAFAAPAATHILAAGEEGSGGRFILLPADAAGVKTGARRTIDKTRALAMVECAGAQGEVLTGENAPAALPQVLAAGRIMLAADLLGAGEAMLERAVAYAKEREQFGQVIGSFQAVKHLCAEMAAALAPCRAFMWQAAHSFDRREEKSEALACLAKAHIAEAAYQTARKAVEVYGGAGIADFTGLHFWFKRIGAGKQLLGDPARLFEEAARLQGWTDES